MFLLLFAASPTLSGYNPLLLPTKVKHIINLTAESTGWSAELFWTATFDQDLVAFAVQRSFDGIDYQDIINYDRHFVAAGDTDAYREQDSDPLPGENFYRVRFILADGEQVFSERKKLYFKEVAAFEIFPNPTGRQVNLLMKKFRGKEVEVMIFDGVGNQVYQQHIANVDEGMLRIELETMHPGIYSVSILHRGKTFTRRLVVTSLQEN
ncbi:MAG: T9SS type A sorting domain-containing protein [Saprospiraceae bacterium]|nr:T9SS type A sorting domain-containing protein [Saprospiraceae bacterium]